MSDSTNSSIDNLLSGETRAAAVNDITGLVNTTVANLSGLTGMAVKPAIAAVQKADPDAITQAVEMGMPDIVNALRPFWDAHRGNSNGTSTRTSGTGSGFGDYLASRSDEVVAALLDTADGTINRAPGAIQKLYSAMRGKAEKVVGPALPELGAIVEKHAG